MKHAYRSLFAAVFFFVLLAQSVSAYSLPERLEYDVTWLGMSVGSAVIEAEQKGQQIHYSARANTGKWVSYLYPVEDALSSIHERRQLRDRQKTVKEIPLHYEVKLNEDKVKVYNEIVFNHGAKNVTFINHATNEKTTSPLKENSFDILYLIYQIRKMPLQVGKSVFVDVADNMQLYRIEVQVLKKESIKTELGMFNTVLIKPLVNIPALGIMYLPGDLFIWLTDDDRRIPVLIEKRVIIPQGSRIPEILRRGIQSAAGTARMVLKKGI